MNKDYKVEKMTPSKSNSGNHKAKLGADDQKKDQIRLRDTPDYKKLLDLYQLAEFKQCEELLNKLTEQYPDNEELERFERDLLLKLSFKDSIKSVAQEEKQKKKKNIFRMSLFAVITTVVVATLTLFISFLINVNQQTKQLEQDYLALTSLENQAKKLIDAGKPQPAADIIERMKSVNSDYENLPELISATEDLLQMEQDYDAALDLIVLDQKQEALEILQEIESKRSGMWDVEKQIEMIETTFLIDTYLDEGDRSFIAEDWDGVIHAYESMLAVEPDLEDSRVKEQLIQAYLNKIIGLLDKKDTTVEDIDNAESYYRKATSLVSQSRAFVNERESLQKVSSDLLQVKYTQVAKTALADKNQTSATIAEAVSLFRKAANLDPENKAFSEDLRNAEYYHLAVLNILDMKWDAAITHLKLLVSIDPNYAGGNASILLYEAYYAVGKQYNSLGLYLDAIRELEQAEILAWADSENLLKLFQVQTLIGETLGKLNNYQDAVSYYKFAFDAVNSREKLGDFPDLAEKLSDTNTQVAFLNFDDAYLGYQDLMNDIDVIFSKPEVQVNDGAFLAFFANENLSTIDAIIEANNIPANMTVSFGRKLIVPKIEK